MGTLRSRVRRGGVGYAATGPPEELEERLNPVTANAVRVVVGEGHPARKGLLRFVLEGDGYDVVGSATSSSELARMIADTQPDVVVLDDGIGATAVQMSREIAPAAKIVLVWPGAVVPIGGDARVEPSQVLRQLGTTVAQVALPIATVSTLQQPEWVERVRKDPATLRDMLAAKGGMPRTRPSVTELQRRGQRLHPSTEPAPEVAAADAEPPSRDDEAAAAALFDPAGGRRRGRRGDGGLAKRRRPGAWGPRRRRGRGGGRGRRGCDPDRRGRGGAGEADPRLDRREPADRGDRARWRGGHRGGGPVARPVGHAPVPDPRGLRAPDPQPGRAEYRPARRGDRSSPSPAARGDPTAPAGTAPTATAAATGASAPPATRRIPRRTRHWAAVATAAPRVVPVPVRTPTRTPDPGPDPGPGPSPNPGPRDDGTLPGSSENNPHGGPPGITGQHPWPDGNPGGHVPGTGDGRHDVRGQEDDAPRHHHKR